VDFTFSEEQRMSAEVVRELLADRCTGADLRGLIAAGGARDDDRWRALVDMGLPGLMMPATAGGLGLAEEDLVLIAEACGYACLPEPLIEHAGVAAPMLAALDHPTAIDWAERAATGEITAAVGHTVDPFVADADTAGVLLIARDDALFMVEPAAATLTRHPSIDPFRRLFDVAFQTADAIRVAEGVEASALHDLAFDRGALFSAAQGLGIAQRAVDMAAAYAKERMQFGKSIGANQAVKHALATCQVKIEFARPVVYAAAAQIGQADVFSRARISHAKLAALGAADLAARSAIQVHGAMGYSWEIDAHFYLKRSLGLTGAWGDEAFHRTRVTERALSASLAPDQTFAASRRAALAQVAA
jgi:alkylation response protein AidB-like acyl-CoA dehydrogenase